MAQKPREQWSETYRRRIERAEARGLSRQQARGHKAHEHVTRRLRKEGVLPPYEPPKRAGKPKSSSRAARINRFLKWRPWIDRDDFKEWDKETGRGPELIETVRSMHRQYQQDIRNGTWVSRGAEFLDDMAAMYDVPANWMQYH